ncbi:GNAT family N-acetyltransferase [Micromonospora sp. NBRC 107095]|uniref:GNAT family N-acetyltransferase n=1 Tax=Micromonospora sp. NBRC 107095 TaxID=3032209 RepID=UPI0024A3A8AE|nr:GNAT family N-acetyltransferase [Micromonospora sp. NBRC 107095]GLZ57778.1 hypothetical protein Misp05_13540 [Micromonospora sp. NBRC 107095]
MDRAIAILDGELVGCPVATRSQDDPAEIYLQDVMTDPNRRRRGWPEHWWDDL